MRAAALSCLFVAPFAAAQSGNAAASSHPGRFDLIGEAVARVPGDLRGIFGYPFDQPSDFSKYALGIGVLVLLDKPITKAYQERVEKPLAGFKVPDAPGPFKNMGTGGTDGWLLMGIAGTYLGGLATDDALTQRAGLAAGKSVVYSVLVSQLLLKSVFGRKRPVASIRNDTPDGTYTNDPHDFGNRRTPTYKSDQYGSSFPSFHFTTWFAVAKVYSEAYDNVWIPYSLMTVGLASNIRGHRHWVGDMAAGALIGTLIGASVSKDYFGRSVRVEPTFRSGGAGLQLSYAF